MALCNAWTSRVFIAFSSNTKVTYHELFYHFTERNWLINPDNPWKWILGIRSLNLCWGFEIYKKKPLLKRLKGYSKNSFRLNNKIMTGGCAVMFLEAVFISSLFEKWLRKPSPIIIIPKPIFILDFIQTFPIQYLLLSIDHLFKTDETILCF